MTKSLKAISNIYQLLRKDTVIEWRQKSTLAAMMVYVISTVFVIYFSFTGVLEGSVWMAIYWIILLFVVVNLAFSSFKEESERQFYYIRTIAKPGQLVAAKMIFNAIYFIVLALLTLGILFLFFGIQISNLVGFILVVIVGSIGLSNIFTLLSAITARVKNTALLAVLGFPIVIPLLLLSIRLSSEMFKMMDRKAYQVELLSLIGLDVLIMALSIILFTYIWRD